MTVESRRVPQAYARHFRVSRMALLVGASLLFCVASGGALSVLGGDPRAAEAAVNPARTITVTIDNFTFTPAVVAVTPGTTVTWVNADDIPHTVTEMNRAFKSPALDTDDKFSHTFGTPGEVEYFCSLHPHMTGKIIVKAADPSS